MTGTWPARLRSWRGLTLLETAAVMLIVAVLAVPLVVVASQLIILPAKWQENLGAVRDAREALRRVASDARQSACYTGGNSSGDYGTFTWTDYMETGARSFRVRYYSNGTELDGSHKLMREEKVDPFLPRTTFIGSVRGLDIRQDGRLIRVEVEMSTRAGEGANTNHLEIATMMRPDGPAIRDC